MVGKKMKVLAIVDFFGVWLRTAHEGVEEERNLEGWMSEMRARVRVEDENSEGLKGEEGAAGKS